MMKNLITFILLFTIFFCSRNVNAQIRDFQLKNDQADTVWRVMLTDTVTGLGSWQEIDSLNYYNTFGGDVDWYKYGTTAIPNNTDTASRTGVTYQLNNPFIYKRNTGGQYNILKNIQTSGITNDWYSSIDTVNNAGSIRDNFVHSMGFNLSPRGGLVNPGRTALGWGYEDHYEPTPGDSTAEAHMLYVDAAGDQFRLSSYTIDKDNPDTWQMYHTLKKFYFRYPVTNGTYYAVETDGNESTNFYVQGPNSETGLLFTVDAAATNFTLYPYGYAGTNKRGYMDQWDGIDLPSFYSYRTGGGTGYANRAREYLVGWGDNDTNLGDVNGFRFSDIGGCALKITAPGNYATKYFEVTDAGVIMASEYPNTRDDGTPTNLLGTSGTGLLQSYPYGDVAGVESIESVSNDGGNIDLVDTWGLNITGNDGANTISFLIDSAEVATQYDLTLISGSGADHDWYEVGGMVEPDNIDDNMYSGTGNHGIGTSTPSKPLHVVGEARITGSGGTATTITGRDTDEDLTDVTTGWGIDLTSGALVVDSSQVATQYDITTVLAGGMTNWYATATGGTGSEEINNGETLTFAGAGINVATRSGATITVTGTEVDGSTSNELQDLTITGASAPFTLDISGSSNDVQFNSSGIVSLSESPANTLVISATEVDGSITNEGILGVSAGTGTTSVITSNTSGAAGVTITAAGINTISETTSSNGGNITITGTEVDGSIINELNTIEEGNVIVQTGNITTDYQTLFDVAADGATEVNVSLDLSEATTVTTVESDDWMIMHDAGLAQHQKMLWTDFSNDLITFEEGNVSEGSGNTIDFGEGIDLSFAGTEADISLDFNEFIEDLSVEGDEYIILYDPSALTQEKVIVTDITGGNGIYGGDGTTPADVDVTMTDNIRFGDGSENDLFIDATNDRIGMGTGSPSYGVHVHNDAGMAVESATAGTGGLIFKIEGKADGGGAAIQQSIFQSAYTDSDYAGGVEQTAFQMITDKRADATQNTTITFRLPENTDADMVMEKNADLSNNTTESHITINGGLAFTQNYDYSTAADLELDRSYHILNVTGGAVTDTIKLPEVNSTSDNWDSALTATQVQVGQEYIITNFRSGVNLVVAAHNPTSGNSDLIDSQTNITTYSAVTISTNESRRFVCVRLATGVGYWYTYD